MCGCNCNDFVMNIGATGPQGPVGPTGPKGDPGSTIYYTTNDSLVGVSQTPSSSPINGDWLLVQTTGNWYRRESNAWVLKYKSGWGVIKQNLTLIKDDFLPYASSLSIDVYYRIVNNLLFYKCAATKTNVELTDNDNYVGFAFSLQSVLSNFTGGGTIYTSDRQLTMIQYKEYSSQSTVERAHAEFFLVGNDGLGDYYDNDMLGDGGYNFSQVNYSNFVVLKFTDFGSSSTTLVPNVITRKFYGTTDVPFIGFNGPSSISFNISGFTQIEMA